MEKQVYGVIEIIYFFLLWICVGDLDSLLEQVLLIKRVSDMGNKKWFIIIVIAYPITKAGWRSGIAMGS